MRRDEGVERGEHGGCGADPVGQGGDAQLHPLLGVGLALAVERQVLAVLGLQDHGQEVRPFGAMARDATQYMSRAGLHS